MSGISVTIPIVRTSRLAASLLVALLVSFHAHADADEFEFFEKRIRPVLVEKCYQCHSATSEKLKGALRLDTREGMLQGGESGRPRSHTRTRRRHRPSMRAALNPAGPVPPACS